MNKYQKKLHREVKEAIGSNTNFKYKIAKRILKLAIKINPFTPCEDCVNMYCRRTKNKIVYCRWQL